MPMVKQLKKHGNSLALVIDRAILAMLNINAQTELIVSTDGTKLIIEPVQVRENRNTGSSRVTDHGEAELG